MDLSDQPRLPILAALYHPPGGIIRHDAVVWGYARACDRMGVEIHPYTEVTGIRVSRGKAESVITNRGEVAAGTVVNATAGWASMIARMAGVTLPIVSHPLQACVTEPLKPFLDKVIVSASLHVYVNQTDKGELVIGAEIDPYQSYSLKGTLPTLEQMASYTLELFPQLSGLRVLRQWAGICDMTPDYAPIIGASREVENYYVDVGWGTYGFKAAPAAAKNMAELIATGKDAQAHRAFLAGALLRRATGGRERPRRRCRHRVITMVDQIKALVKDKGIEYFFCSFVELSGAPKAKLVPATHLDDMAREGAGFAGFAAGDLNQGPHDPDIVSIPDFNSLTVLPWRKNVAWVPGNLHVNGQPWPYCPRTILTRQLELARQEGLHLPRRRGAGVHAAQEERAGETTSPGMPSITLPSPVTTCARSTAIST